MMNLKDHRAEAILATLWLENSLHFTVAVGMGITPDHFTIEALSEGWKIGRRLYDKEALPDNPRLAIIEELRNSGKNDLATELQDNSQAIEYLNHAGDKTMGRPSILRLLELRRLRLLNYHASQVIVALDNPQNLSNAWSRALSGHSSMSQIILAQEAGILDANDQWNEAQKLMVGEGSGYVSTGNAGLDRILGGGFHKARVNVIAAPTSHGKSNLVIWFLDNILQASENGVVLLFTPELTKGRVANRRICRHLRIPNYELGAKKSPELILPIKKKLTGFIVDDNIQPSVEYMMMRTRAVADEHELLAVGFDYAERVNEPGEMRQRITNAMIGGERIAKRYEIPFLMVSQVSREGLTAAKPNLSHMSESSSIEKFSSCVMISRWGAKRAEQLHRKKFDGHMAGFTTWIAKNTEGETGKHEWYTEPQYHNFTDVDPLGASAIPEAPF